MPDGAVHTDDVAVDTGQFQALFEKILGIPAAGRSIYDRWLASRWQEAVANWAIQTSPTIGVGEPGGTATEFEEFLNLGRGDPERLFGGGQEALAGISRLGGVEQRSLIERLGTKVAGAGISGRDVTEQAFLDAMQGRFGRRGGLAITGQALSPERFRRFQLDFPQVTGEELRGGPADVSFLNQRLAALREQMGF